LETEVLKAAIGGTGRLAPTSNQALAVDVPGASAAGTLDLYRKASLSAWAAGRPDRVEERLQTILDSMPQMVWSAGADGRHDYFNRQWHEFTGIRRETGKTINVRELLHPKDVERVSVAWTHSLVTGEPFEIGCRLRHRSGEYWWTLTRARPERNASGRVIRWFGTCTDVHRRVQQQRMVRESDALNRSILDSSPDCIMMLELAGDIVFVNHSGTRVLGMQSSTSLVGTRWIDLLPPSAVDDAQRALDVARTGGRARFTAAVTTAEETTAWWDIIAAPVIGDDGQPASLVVIARDVTHQKMSEEQALWAANHDALTGLPNRAFFQQRLDQYIKHADKAESGFGLLLLDVDNFKRVNDTLGHDTGDALLRTIAARLKSATRAEDLVVRLGGDEFAVVLAGANDAEKIEAVTRSILLKLREPCSHTGRLLECLASIGASIYRPGGMDKVELLKQADIALYAAKDGGRATFRIFESSMRKDMQRRLSMLSVAREALRRNRIVPFYQPKLNLQTGRLAGFEALLRWRHPRHGIQTPDTMAAAFQDASLAREISDRMIALVISDVQGWIRAGVRFGHVAINAAAAEMKHGDFAEWLLERLAAAAVPTRCFQLEVTETVFLGDGADYVEHALRTLSAAGVRICLDDFGTGYASLSHLKKFPVDIIKIDRTFLRDLHHHQDNEAIVRTVINLGKSLAIEVVAEGIETPAQSAYLRKHGCEYGQGFLFGAAAPRRDVPTLVASISARADRLEPISRMATSSNIEPGGEDSGPIAQTEAPSLCLRPSRAAFARRGKAGRLRRAGLSR
jgi:diguanylate cyclase (GGDEF)-like protein/PAS domain S-box-containing protein